MNKYLYIHIHYTIKILLLVNVKDFECVAGNFEVDIHIKSGKTVKYLNLQI